MSNPTENTVRDADVKSEQESTEATEPKPLTLQIKRLTRVKSSIKAGRMAVVGTIGPT
jgi:hypothetical protein